MPEKCIRGGSAIFTTMHNARSRLIPSRSRWLFVAVLFFAVVAVPSRLALAADPNLFADVSQRTSATPPVVLLPARVWIPRDAMQQPAVDRPLVVFLHGAGESGTNNTSQVNGNIDNLLAEMQRRNVYLLAPQWGGANNFDDAVYVSRIQQLVDSVATTYSIDRSRVYVTGLSAGGGRTQRVLINNASTFAAAVPICAVIAFGQPFAQAAGKPFWLFHARDDSVVVANNSRNAFNLFLTANAITNISTWPASGAPDAFFERGAPANPGAPTPFRYTEYATGNHGIWGRVYADAAMYNWLFSFTSCSSCRADFDCSRALQVRDIFTFLAAWFLVEPRTDFNNSGGIDVDDIFAFLATWFAGC